MAITVAKAMDEGDIAKRDEDEQRVIEATIRNRANSIQGGDPAAPTSTPTSQESGLDSSNTEHSVDSGGDAFGSSLENYNRSRAYSNTSYEGGEGTGGTHAHAPIPVDEDNASALLASLAMSPEERREIESEMRAQLSHPTHRRIQDEAEEARMQHQQEWISSEAGTRQRVRESRMVELARLLHRAEDGGEFTAGMGLRDGGTATRRTSDISDLVRSLETSGLRAGGSAGRGRIDDLVRLEAAIFLSMEDDARTRGESAQRSRRGTGRRFASARNLGEDGLRSDNEGDSNSGNEADLREESEGLGNRLTVGRGSESRRRLVSGRGPISRRAGRGLGNRGVSATHLDTAELLMRGISEDDQLAMAIALSMRDNGQPNGESSNRSSQNAEGESSSSALTSQAEEGNAEGAANEIEGEGGTDDEEEVVFMRADDESSGNQALSSPLQQNHDDALSSPSSNPREG